MLGTLFRNLMPTTRKSGVIDVLVASLMTSSTKFSGVESEFTGIFYAQNVLNGLHPSGNVTPYFSILANGLRLPHGKECESHTRKLVMACEGTMGVVW